MSHYQRNKSQVQSSTNLQNHRGYSQDNYNTDRYSRQGNQPYSASTNDSNYGSNDALSHSQYSGKKQANPLNLQKRMVKVINGKIIKVPENDLSTQHIPSRAQSQRQLPNLQQNTNTFCEKPCSTRCAPTHQEDIKGLLNNAESILSSNKKVTYQQCPAEAEYINGKHLDEVDGKGCQAKSLMDSEVDSYINMNDIYYKHLRGLCVCARCTCGKHKCAFAKNSHLKQPFSQTPPQSIYKLNYTPKKGLKDIDFDYGMYENMKSNTNTIDTKSINHSDFTKPDQKYYLSQKDCKPEYKYDYKPLQCGRSAYKRDYLEWGCVPHQPIKGYSQRTTIDAMPFHGQTTYGKDFQKTNGPAAERAGNNHTTTMVKSPIPFLGVTTSQEFFKPYKPGDRAIRYKASDELVTGAPSFKGQFESLSQKDYINYTNICPVEIELRQSRQQLRNKDNQVEAN